MDISSLIAESSPGTAGEAMHALCAELYPICRSVTGEGVRETLRILSRILPLEVAEVPSGTQVFDWQVPPEWTIRDAWIKDPGGRKIVDFKSSNLHLVSYSSPVRAKLPLADLRRHLHSLPDRPDWIPYRTSYYQETWGFCLPHRQLEGLGEGEYEVLVDSTLAPGSLTYGECYLAGESAEEILLSCHVCHPSLCNDNLSGIALTAWLGAALGRVERRWSYRLLFIPGTIGSITWLARNEATAGRIRAGLVAANLGDPGAFHYKKSRRGDAEIDRAAVQALRDLGEPFEVSEFVPYGYDERQYCSPGFNLPVGSLTRTPYGCFPEYHTSADDLDFVRPAALEGSFCAYLRVVEILERNRCYLNLQPKCEPQLGRRGLYGSLGGADTGRERELAMLWLLNYGDSEHSLLDIAELSGLSFALLDEVARPLVKADLLRELPTGS